MFHELAETSSSTVPHGKGNRVRCGFDECPSKLRVERSDKLGDLFE